MRVLLHPVSAKYLTRLNEPDKSHIKNALQGLEREPPAGDIKPITGQSGNFRLRIGSYRVFFRHRDDHIFVTHIEPRGQAYKKKNRGNRK
ncbi:MAG: type II toxin-antitoxin system RelE/ParE family toxin [Spirochaetota bacterium]|jgi:mRNA interferase RelE/StbE|nr:type II toxin-antitoxin system RelE/ParE family toxin [Spirochaetota bacterium]